jgi:hypothetical protein
MKPRLTPFTRFLLGHMLAYVPGFLWAAAWIPRAIEAELDELAAASDEATVRAIVMRKMLLPFVVAFGVTHLWALPWVRRDDATTRALLLVGTGLACLAAVVYGVWAWAALLRGG